jgi:hypothetical protein
MPCLAPRDVATTRLIGTAIPRAQGQAITKTATAFNEDALFLYKWLGKK